MSRLKFVGKLGLKDHAWILHFTSKRNEVPTKIVPSVSILECWMKRKMTVNSRRVFEGYMKDFIVMTRSDSPNAWPTGQTIPKSHRFRGKMRACRFHENERQSISVYSVTCSVNGAPADWEEWWTPPIVPSARAELDIIHSELHHWRVVRDYNVRSKARGRFFYFTLSWVRQFLWSVRDWTNALIQLH